MPLFNERYPESVIRKNKFLEKANENLRNLNTELENHLHELTFEKSVLMQMVKPNEVSGEVVWVWQHDGYDFLRSMRNEQAILISAEDLRDLLENGEKVEYDGEPEAPIKRNCYENE